MFFISLPPPWFLLFLFIFWTVSTSEQRKTSPKPHKFLAFSFPVFDLPFHLPPMLRVSSLESKSSKNLSKNLPRRFSEDGQICTPDRRHGRKVVLEIFGAWGRR